MTWAIFATALSSSFGIAFYSIKTRQTFNQGAALAAWPPAEVGLASLLRVGGRRGGTDERNTGFSRRRLARPGNVFGFVAVLAFNHRCGRHCACNRGLGLVARASSQRWRTAE